MSVDHDHGVSLQDLHAPPGRADAPGASQAGPAPAPRPPPGRADAPGASQAGPAAADRRSRSEPAVPADILARAQTAIRRANRPAFAPGDVEERPDDSPDGATAEPELPIDSSPGDPADAS